MTVWYAPPMRTFGLFALFVVVGLIVGGAAGLFAPFLVAQVVGVENGSYETFLLPWMLTVPSGALVGAWGGARIARAIDRTRAAR